MEKIVAIASGKGGVGKSTVAANLAVALANHDLDGSGPKKVALVDVDFYGPSIPTLMGGGEVKPDADNRLIPASRFKVKYVSIAFFLKNPDDPVVWRGPMFGKAMHQLFNDVNWGEIDICLVDMPPGTGDAQLSLSQMLQLDGALLVTTPQEVALSDVRRAINMFRKVEVPVLGLVENMAGFTTPTGEHFDIFGSGGGRELSDSYGTPLLGSLPIDMELRAGGDKGDPVALDKNTPSGRIFSELGSALLSELAAGVRPQLKVQN